MDISDFTRAVCESDPAPIVICDLDHRVVYANRAAKERYRGKGTEEGCRIADCHSGSSFQKIRKIVSWFAEDSRNNRVRTMFNEKENKDVYMVALRDDDGILIGYYEKHETRTPDDCGFYDMRSE